MRFNLSFLLLFLFSYSNAQEEIFLLNPSFEGFPKLSNTPGSWFDCGFPGESAVDIHPVPESEFLVDKVALDGETYLGMVTRENETWEAIGQRLSQPLLEGKTYRFNINLAQSLTYFSSLSSRNNTNIYGAPKKTNFATPIKLRIWGGNGYCKKEELLAESPLISNTDWLNFVFTLRPENELNYITLEAYYETPNVIAYNGNILLDNASSIVKVINDDFTFADSIRKVQLDSLAKILKSSPSTTESASNIKSPGRYKEGKLSDKDRMFVKKQLALVKFEPNSKYLEDDGIDAIIKIATKLNEVEEDLKISFYINTPDKSWDKGRGREVLSLFVEAGILRTNVRISKSIPAKEKTYFRGGYSDIYLCVY